MVGEFLLLLLLLLPEVPRYSDAHTQLLCDASRHWEHHGKGEGRTWGCVADSITTHVNAAKCSFESPDTPGVKNYGSDCWGGCGGKQGPCNWCG